MGLSIGVATSGLAVLLTVSGWMTDEQITAAFSGRTIEGVYASGLTFVERYEPDGRLDYREPVRHMMGRWSVVSGNFCTLYDAGAGGGCFRVVQTSANCYEFYIAAFTEEEAAEDPQPLGWTARGWRQGERSTCEGVPTA